jgi:hypothetical protein
MKMDQTKLSRAISHALRRESWLYELEPGVGEQPNSEYA